jgi:Ca-activated chloride channel family protein
LISIFEITLSKEITNTVSGNEFADVRLQYKLPSDSTNRQFRYSSKMDLVSFDKAEKCYRFSAAVVMFGSMLRYSAFVKNMTWNDVVARASSSIDEQDLLQKEFVGIVQQAKTLYSKIKKKKGVTNYP